MLCRAWNFVVSLLPNDSPHSICNLCFHWAKHLKFRTSIPAPHHYDIGCVYLDSLNGSHTSLREALFVSLYIGNKRLVVKSKLSQSISTAKVETLCWHYVMLWCCPKYMTSHSLIDKYWTAMWVTHQHLEHGEAITSQRIPWCVITYPLPTKNTWRWFIMILWSYHVILWSMRGHCDSWS